MFKANNFYHHFNQKQACYSLEEVRIVLENKKVVKGGKRVKQLSETNKLYRSGLN